MSPSAASSSAASSPALPPFAAAPEPMLTRARAGVRRPSTRYPPTYVHGVSVHRVARASGNASCRTMAAYLPAADPAQPGRTGLRRSAQTGPLTSANRSGIQRPPPLARSAAGSNRPPSRTVRSAGRSNRSLGRLVRSAGRFNRHCDRPGDRCCIPLRSFAGAHLGSRRLARPTLARCHAGGRPPYPHRGFCFRSTRSDASLFVYRTDNDMTYLLLYVDDIILTTSTAGLLRQLTDSLRAEFALKDLGPLHYFLGIEVVRRADGFFLHRRK
ncbi:hypothetical protein QYE76_014979 [Lolium multiflorum]|uniref:Reverse transcriptase Ty1/copia-type domain-containing protein n=1 Tax=Lolium multiflorum TaxID=4521 RepID=A0AAD8X8P5_LOLMU|nr:hypothetical protein QYE76_014979 [Lolium multiflorum]